jgi:two-component system, OmpR family, response regulator
MTKKILVVENEAVSQKILRDFLGREGYETAGAKDGLEAMELLGQLRFDLVLSDLRMPRMGGLALARHILSAFPITPIFLITADALDNLEAISALGIPCLNKPLSLNDLLVRIQTVLGVRRVEH